MQSHTHSLPHLQVCICSACVARPILDACMPLFCISLCSSCLRGVRTALTRLALYHLFFAFDGHLAIPSSFLPCCYRLSMRKNCCTIRTAAHVIWSGVVSPMMRVSFMTLVSAKAQVAFPP